MNVDVRLRRSRALVEQNELKRALEDANYASKYGSLSGRIIAERIRKILAARNEKNQTEVIPYLYTIYLYTMNMHLNNRFFKIY